MTSLVNTRVGYWAGDILGNETFTSSDIDPLIVKTHKRYKAYKTIGLKSTKHISSIRLPAICVCLHRANQMNLFFIVMF